VGIDPFVKPNPYYMKAEEFKPLVKNKTLSTLSNQEFNLLITSKDPLAVKWRKLHKEEFKLRLRASDLLNDFFRRNTFQ
jgi:lysyl-tRNA synthetase class II